MESGCLMVGVDPGGEGSLPVITVFRHELNGSYSVVKSFTGEEAECVYGIIACKNTRVAFDDDDYALLMSALKKHCKKEE